MISHKPHRPIVLTILDGWGYRASSTHNAIAAANTPNWNQWWATRPKTLLKCSGECVGLPPKQMGNSEVGHMHIGAGRVINQDLTRIKHAITSGEFQKNTVFLNAFQEAIRQNVAIHVFGLLSPGGVHSHEQQIFALAKLAAQQGVKKLFFHAFLDGRDTPPQSAQTSLNELHALLTSTQCGEIASITGRYYAMDRDQHWDRTQRAYELLTEGNAEFVADNVNEALTQAYDRLETDEFVQPTRITTTQSATINDDDIAIFMNFRADRARQLTRALTERNFNGFHREKFSQLTQFITLTKYAADIQATIAYPPETLRNVLGEYLANQGSHQLRIAETEKYAHVTFFLNGGTEMVFPGEDRILVPSPKVATYDLQPEMSAPEVTDKLIEAIHSEHYDAIICNFANADMVGHTGDFQATVAAIECLDQCLGKIEAQLLQVGGEMLITADHGNAEKMFDEKTKQPHTAHTSRLIPFIYLGRSAEVTTQEGNLIDVAPTMLYLMDLQKPQEMTGKSLLTLLNNT